MATKRNSPDKQHAKSQKWSDKKVERFETYIQQAIDHTMGRNSRIVKILCYVSLMRCAGKVAANASVNVVAAKWQNYSSQKGNEAAHYLPGQLMINQKQVSQFISDKETCKKINCLFGDVEDLLADFNKADTQAEAKGQSSGLCAAFKDAVQYVMINHTSSPNVNNPSAPNKIDRQIVRHAYQNVWVPKARIAINNALQQKAGKFTKPEITYGTSGGIEYGMITNLSARENLSEYQQGIDHQQEILRHYLKSFNDKAPSELKDPNMDKLEKEFKA